MMKVGNSCHDWRDLFKVGSSVILVGIYFDFPYSHPKPQGLFSSASTIWLSRSESNRLLARQTVRCPVFASEPLIGSIATGEDLTDRIDRQLLTHPNRVILDLVGL